MNLISVKLLDEWQKCRSWSSAAFCGVWSGSTLFALACISEYVNTVIWSNRPPKKSSWIHPCYSHMPQKAVLSVNLIYPNPTIVCLFLLLFFFQPIFTHYGLFWGEILRDLISLLPKISLIFATLSKNLLANSNVAKDFAQISHWIFIISSHFLLYKIFFSHEFLSQKYACHCIIFIFHYQTQECNIYLLYRRTEPYTHLILRMWYFFYYHPGMWYFFYCHPGRWYFFYYHPGMLYFFLLSPWQVIVENFTYRPMI